MLKIGDFSKLSRVSIRMLRHYDEIGLLAPGKVDAFTGYRYYGEEQLPTIYRINALKEMGFGLAERRNYGIWPMKQPAECCFWTPLEKG